MFCFGVDIGGTTIKLGLFDLQGDVLDKWEIPTRKEDEGKNILPDAARAVLSKMNERSLSKEDVAGIGVGVPGPVKEDGTVETAVNLGWDYMDVQGTMQKETGLPVKVSNDANVAALGEAWVGGAKGCKDVILATLGTGVGGGLITNGKIITGAHGAGGEIGHMHLIDDFPHACNCGNYGCLEQVASATGITYLAEKALADSQEASVLRDRKVSAKAVFDAVKENDALAIAIAEQFGKYLGKALAMIAAVTDPEVIVIGGGVSKAGTVLLDFVDKNFQVYAFSSCRKATFALAELGNDAGIFGAAKMALDTYASK